MIAPAVAGDLDECPHPLERDRHSITVFAAKQPLVLCIDCFEGFRALVKAWDDGALSREHVYRWFMRAGWPRSDADTFIKQTLSPSLWRRACNYLLGRTA